MEGESIAVECPSCRKRLRVPVSAAGQAARCPSCRSAFAVPAPPDDLPPIAEVISESPFDFPDDDAPRLTRRPARSKAPECEDDDDTGPPFFMGIETRTWTPNRVYRVFVLPDELVFVWAGGGNDVTIALAAGGGLIGGLIAAAVNPTKKNTTRKKELDTTTLEELRDDHKHNFALRFEEIEEASVTAPSFWFRINNAAVPQVGVLRLRDPGRGRTTLALGTNEDVKRALDLLPERFGERLQVGLEWDARDRKYRRA
ncbi:MAG TPA: hypothetical protein VKE74_21545 [Gemmataceae bacterium]|nr:hypothetical protein [Gemmataceae bacterium]